MFRLCRLSLLGLGGLLATLSLQSQVPLEADQLVLADEKVSIISDWRAESARRALESGLPLLAESIYRSMLQSTAVVSGSERTVELTMGLAKALIGQARFLEAKAVLESVDPKYRGAEHAIFLAMTLFGEDANRLDREAFFGAVRSIREQDVAQDSLPWFFLLQGLRASLEGDASLATEAFERAANLAQTSFLRSHFESLALRQKILNTSGDESLAAELAARLDKLEGQAAAYPYLREYAIVLHGLGRDAEAVGALERALANTSAGFSAAEREQLRLLKGVILGANSLSGRAVLKELIRRNGSSRQAMSVALQLLARAQEQETDFMGFLNEIISQKEPHALLGQMYYLRSQLALSYPEMMATAERDARTLLEQFPGLSEITNVYRLLAYAALQKEPPQYRAAADFLIQLRDQTTESQPWMELNRMIGDCYYLNQDYDNAVDFYRAARSRELDVDRDSSLFLRLITAEVKAGRIDAAINLIDEADFSGSIELQERWRAEWNIAQALRGAGSLDRALERVRLLLQGATSGSVPVVLDLRLRWLEAYLSLETGETGASLEQIDRMLNRLDSLPGDALEASESVLLKTEILLLKGTVLMRIGQANEGVALLSELRSEYPDSAAAERSYLIESNYHAVVGDFQAAQSTLTRFVELYAESPLAPQALYEAALYCERRGSTHYPEAIVLHNSVVSAYPTDPLVYFAQLKQGDLLRLMNDFAGAQIVYENLINAYPTHAKRYVAELSRADCMLALAENQSASLQDVAVVLERLIDLPDLPLDFQVEVAHKWAFALLKNEATEAAQEVLTISIGRYLLDGEQAAQLNTAGRYWIARSMLSLGEILEEQGGQQEARRIYRKLVAYNLPGRQIALSRIDRLTVID